MENEMTKQSLEDLYLEAMQIAGYEIVETEPGGLVTVTFQKTGTDEKIGFDGWGLVGSFLEDEVELSDAAQREQINNIIHPQGRVGYYTLNLGGTGLNEDMEPVFYNDFSNALNDFLNADVDGKSMGVILNGEYTELAAFDVVAFKNQYLTNTNDLSESFAVNELRQLRENMQTLKTVLDNDNAVKTLQYNFSELASIASSNMIRQNSEWGSWFGRIANNNRPQDYISVDITGYSTHHEISYEVNVVHANDVVGAKKFTAKTDVDNLEESIKAATQQAVEEFKDYLKDSVSKLDTNIESPFTVYSPFLGEELEEHYKKLNNAGYEEEPSYDFFQQAAPEADNEPLVNIGNLAYDEGGLHFTVEADGYELEGYFNVYDPANGEDMTLVSVDYGYMHPIIARQWGRIESALADVAAERYAYLKEQALTHSEEKNVEIEQVIDGHEDALRNMKTLGYELVQYKGFSDDGLISFYEIDNGVNQFGFDGWDKVEGFVEDIYRLVDNYSAEEINAHLQGDYSVIEYNTFDIQSLEAAVKNYDNLMSARDVSLFYMRSDEAEFPSWLDVYNEITERGETARQEYAKDIADYITSHESELSKETVDWGNAIIKDLSGYETIGGYECKKIDEWENGTCNYMLGQAREDDAFFYAQVTEADEQFKGVYVYEYDHNPTRNDIEDRHLDNISAIAIDRHEAEYGADGNINFPNRNEEEKTVNDDVWKNRDLYKFFYAGEQDKEAEAFQEEKGWNKMWATENQGLNGDTWVVYRSVEDLPLFLQDYARAQENAEKKMGEKMSENTVTHGEEKKEDIEISNKGTQEASMTVKDQVMQQLADGIKKTLDSKEFANWCQKQGKLFYNNYSFRNAMLTYLQKPEATYVCGYEKWKDFGRQVNRGAKGIKVLAPVFAKEYNGKGSLYASIKKQCAEQLKKDPDLEYATYQLGKSNLSFLMYKSEQGIGKNPLYDIRVGGNVIKAHATEDEVRKFIDLNVIGKVPTYYNAVTVFDIADTSDNVEFLWVAKDAAKKSEMILDDNGKPITNQKGQVKIMNTPERKARFSGDIEMHLAEQEPSKMQALYDCLKSISENKGIPMTEASKSADSTLEGGALGYFRHPTQEHPKGNIVIDSELSLTDKVAVAFHEMAHSDLHADLEWLKDEMDLDAGEIITKQMKEMQAEAVAYMTASTFGIETQHKSFEYIANWSNGRELKELESSLNVIYKESQSLLKEIEKELDNRGLTMSFEAKDKTPLTEEQKRPLVNETKTFVLNNMRSNETLQKSAFTEMKSADLEQEKNILKEQVLITKEIEEKLGALNSKIEQYEKADTRDEQLMLEMQIKATTSQIMTLQGKVEELSEERVNVVHEQSKEDLKQMYYADPLKALKQMRKDIPQMKELSDTDIKLIAKSGYIEEAYAGLLGKDNQQFAENAMKQLENIKSAMSKNQCVVEVRFCEQWTPQPIFEAGTIAHPKEANKIIANAEKQIRALKAEAEKKDEYFPYAKCAVTVLAVSEKGKVTAFKERVDIGDGFQKDLKDVLEQTCPKSELCQQFVASTRERSNIQLLTPVWEHEIKNENEQMQEPEKQSNSLKNNENNMSMSEWKNQLDRNTKSEVSNDARDIEQDMDKEEEKE